MLATAAADALFGPVATGRPWLDAATCAEAVGFSELGRLAMLRRMDELNARPPFTGQVRYATDRTRLVRQIAASEEALAGPGMPAALAEKLSGVVARDPANAALLMQAGSVAVQTGDHAGALRFLDRLAAIQPFSPEQATLRAVALQSAGRPAEAEAVLQRALDEEPYYFQSYGLLARLWVERGQAAKARAMLADLVERMPDSRQLRSLDAQLRAREGDWVAAEAQWRAVLHLVPDDESALAPLLQRLAGAGRQAEALALMQEAHAYNPRSFANNQRLVDYHDGRGDTARTTAAMLDLAESGPVNALLFRDLALNLEKLGRRPEVRDVLLRGRRLAESEGDAALLTEFNRLLASP